jgi:hypothetical protein
MKTAAAVGANMIAAVVAAAGAAVEADEADTTTARISTANTNGSP